MSSLHFLSEISAGRVALLVQVGLLASNQYCNATDTCELQLPPPWTLPLAALSGGDESLQTDIDNDGSYYLGGGRRQALRLRNFGRSRLPS